MKRRLYLDESVWFALALDGELREAVRRQLRQLIQEGWTLVTSTFAIDRMAGLEGDSGMLHEYLSLIRRICSEIIPVLFDDFEDSAGIVLSHRLDLTGAVHLAIMRRTGCDALSSFSAERMRRFTGRTIPPTGST